MNVKIRILKIKLGNRNFKKKLFKNRILKINK